MTVIGPDGEPWGADIRTLTVISRAPRLYVNHERTHPVDGDIARDVDGDAWRRGRNGWYLTGRLALDRRAGSRRHGQGHPSRRPHRKARPVSRLILAVLVAVPLTAAVLFAGLIKMVSHALIAIDNALTIENGELG